MLWAEPALERQAEVIQGCSDLVDRLNSLVASDVKSGAKVSKLSQSSEWRTGCGFFSVLAELKRMRVCVHACMCVCVCVCVLACCVRSL